MRNFRENILKYGTFFLVFMLPIVYFKNLVFPFITSKTFLFYGVVELIFVIWLYTIYVDKSYRLKKKQFLFFIPVVLYISWMTLAGVFAVNLGLSFWSSLERGTGLLTLYHALALSLVIASLTKHYGILYVHNFFKWSLFGALMLAISIWLGDEGFKIFKLLDTSKGGGLSGNSSLASLYLIFPFFFGAYLLFKEKISRRWKIWAAIILATIIFSPLFINVYGLMIGKGIIGSARGAILGMIISVGIGGLSYLTLSKNYSFKIIGIVGVVIFLTIFSIGWTKLITPDTYLHNKFTEVATGTRFIFWDIGKQAMDKHPFFGYGPENYGIAFEENFNPQILRKEYNNEVWDEKAHNIYFDVGVSGGYPAVLFYVIFLGSFIYGLYRINEKGIFSNLQTGLFVGLMAGYVFQNLFYFDSVLSLMILFSFAGIIYGLQDINIEVKTEEKNKKTTTIKSSINIGEKSLVIFLLTLSFIALSYNFCYLTFKKTNAIIRVSNLPIDKRPIQYDRLLHISPVGDDWDLGGFAYQVYVNYNSYLKDSKVNKDTISYLDKDIQAYIKYL